MVDKGRRAAKGARKTGRGIEREMARIDIIMGTVSSRTMKAKKDLWGKDERFRV